MPSEARDVCLAIGNCGIAGREAVIKGPKQSRPVNRRQLRPQPEQERTIRTVGGEIDEQHRVSGKFPLQHRQKLRRQGARRRERLRMKSPRHLLP